MQDTNRSGWWQLLALVPFGFNLVVIYLAQGASPSRKAAAPAPIPQP
jgi:hypothetical protein